MASTQGTQHRLPEREFEVGDLVVDIDVPKSPLNNGHSSASQRPQKDDQDRYQRFRRYFDLEYGPGKVKFRGQDDFLDVEPDQIPVNNVYGYYEVQHWPGAQEQLQKSKKLLAPLKAGQADTESSLSSSVSLSSQSFHEDEDEVDEEVGEDEQPQVPPSEAHTVDEDNTEDAVYQPTPVSEIIRHPGAPNSGPPLHDFTPVPVRRQRKKARVARNTHTSPTVRRRQGRRPAKVSAEVQISSHPPHTANDTLHPQSSTTAIDPDISAQPDSRGTSTHDTLSPLQRRNSVAAIIARLDQRLQQDKERHDQRLQEDKDSGLISPSGRYYTKYERSVRMGLDPGPLANATYRRLKREKPEYFNPDTGEIDNAKIIEDASESSTFPNKKRKLSETSSKPTRRRGPGIPLQRTLNVQDHFHLEACPIDTQRKIYPTIAQGLVLNNTLLWPVEPNTRESLSEGYQVRVRYVAHAHSHVPSQRNPNTPQQLKVKECVVELYESLMYMYLTVEKFHETDVETVTKVVHKAMLARMKLFERKWMAMMDALNIKYELPTGVETVKKTGGKKVTSSGQQTALSYDTSNARPHSATSIASSMLADSRSSMPNANAIDPPLADFPTLMLYFTTRQLSYLITTIRLQTATPDILKVDSSSAPNGGVSEARRQFEANMQLAGMSWQVEFFESWIRGVQRKKIEIIAGGGHRFWKVRSQETEGDETVRQGRKARQSSKVMDLLTGMKGKVRNDWHQPRRKYTEDEIKKILERHERMESGFDMMDDKTEDLERAKEWKKLIKEANEASNSQVGAQDGGRSLNGSKAESVQQAIRTDARTTHTAQFLPHPATAPYGQDSPLAATAKASTLSQQYHNRLSQLSGSGRLMPPPPPPSRSSFTPTPNLIQQLHTEANPSAGFPGSVPFYPNQALGGSIPTTSDFMPNLDPRLLQISHAQETRMAREKATLNDMARWQGAFEPMDLLATQQPDAFSGVDLDFGTVMEQPAQEPLILGTPGEEHFDRPQVLPQTRGYNQPVMQGLRDTGNQQQHFGGQWPYSLPTVLLPSTQVQAPTSSLTQRYVHLPHTGEFETGFGFTPASVMTQPFSQLNSSTHLREEVEDLRKCGRLPVLPAQTVVSQESSHPDLSNDSVATGAKSASRDAGMAFHLDIGTNSDKNTGGTTQHGQIDVADRGDGRRLLPSSPAVLQLEDDLAANNTLDEDEYMIDAGPPPSPLLPGFTERDGPFPSFDDVMNGAKNDGSKLVTSGSALDETAERQAAAHIGNENGSANEVVLNYSGAERLSRDPVALSMRDEGISLSFDAHVEKNANANVNDTHATVSASSGRGGEGVSVSDTEGASAFAFETGQIDGLNKSEMDIYVNDLTPGNKKMTLSNNLTAITDKRSVSARREANVGSGHNAQPSTDTHPSSTNPILTQPLTTSSTLPQSPLYLHPEVFQQEAFAPGFGNYTTNQATNIGSRVGNDPGTGVRATPSLHEYGDKHVAAQHDRDSVHDSVRDHDHDHDHSHNHNHDQKYEDNPTKTFNLPPITTPGYFGLPGLGLIHPIVSESTDPNTSDLTRPIASESADTGTGIDTNAATATTLPITTAPGLTTATRTGTGTDTRSGTDTPPSHLKTTDSIKGASPKIAGVR